MEKIKVLLVDDDLDFGNTALLLLKKAGYEVYFQNTLFGVESLIMKLSPNLIILDVMIGEENKSGKNQRHPTCRRRHPYHVCIFVT